MGILGSSYILINSGGYKELSDSSETSYFVLET